MFPLSGSPCLCQDGESCIAPVEHLYLKRGTKRGLGGYHFHFVIGREPWYIHYPLTADAMLSNSTEIAG